MTDQLDHSKLLELLRIFGEYSDQLLHKLASPIAKIYGVPREQEQDVFDKPGFAQDMIVLKKEWLIKVQGAAAKNGKLQFNKATAYNTWISVIDRGSEALDENQIPLSTFGRSGRTRDSKPSKTTKSARKSPVDMRALVARKVKRLRDPKDQDEATEKIATAIAARQGQEKFRNDLFNAYGDRCLVTGPNIKDILEAAHIQPYADGGPSELPNGLLLRADIHTLFDLYLLAIDADMKVLISPKLRSTPYAGLAGKPLQFPEGVTDRPSEMLLEQHRQAAGLGISV
jgi:hypothetical protein